MNEQLITYIRQALAANVSREEIISALVAEGWERSDVNVALASFESTASVAPETTPATPSVAGVVSDPTSSAATAAAGAAFTASPAQQQIDNKLPGVFKLLSGGFSIYKDRLGVLVGIGAVQLLLRLLFVGIVLVGIMLGATVFFSHSIIMTIILAVVALLLGIGIVWLLYWITLASWQAVRGHKEKVTFRAAFGSARHLVWSFLWLLIVVMLVSTGGIFLLSLLPSAVLSLLGLLTPIALIIPGIYLVVSLVILVPMFGIWFIFSGWIFLTESQRGIHALTASRELVRGRFWKVFGRAFGVIFIIGIGVVLFKLVLTLILVVIPMAVGIVFLVANTLFFMPFSLAVIYFLYEQVRLQVPAIPQSAPRARKIFITYAIVGVVGGIIVFIILPIILASLNRVRQLGNDSLITSEVYTMRTELVLYESNHNVFPSSLNKAAQSDSTIATLLQQIQKSGTKYTYQSTGSTYTFCMTRSSGSQFCTNQTANTYTK